MKGGPQNLDNKLDSNNVFEKPFQGKANIEAIAQTCINIVYCLLGFLPYKCFSILRSTLYMTECVKNKPTSFSNFKFGSIYIQNRVINIHECNIKPFSTGCMYKYNAWISHLMYVL